MFIKEFNIILIDSDYNIFINYITGTLITLYIDNILITGPSRIDINKVKVAFNAKFYITDFGPYTYYLSIIITRDRPN